MTPRVVVDTSVLVPEQSRKELQRLAEAGFVAAVWSPWIVAELNRVLTWRWIERAGGDRSLENWRACSAAAKTMMELLLASFETVDPRPPLPQAWPTLADPSDRHVLAAAVHASAGFVVSDNRRDFPPPDANSRFRWAGIEYVTAAAFVRRLAAGEFRELDSER